ncbi:MAG: carboxypeptidase regulatory-like domain-containing protein [Phycisphaerae bacterium]|nr:carboxypeptidase regulatory-like domain-containing protein [Phycisphaerae bacterium]
MYLVRNCAIAWFTLSVVGLVPIAPAVAEPVLITGRAVDCRAQPVQGAQVILYNDVTPRPLGQRVFVKLAETQSLPDGRFTLSAERQDSWYSGEWWLIAYKNGLAMGWTTEGLGLRDITVVLSEPKPLGGVVVDETGRPVANAGVSLCIKNEMMKTAELPLPGPEDWHMRRTNAEGRFLFDNIPADSTADFQIEAPGRVPIWTFCRSGLDVGGQYPAGQTDLRIVLPPETRIEGKVINEDTGQGVTGFCVLARPQEQGNADYCPPSASVDPDGRFVLTGLTSGQYRLEAVASEGHEQEWFGQGPVLTVQDRQTTRDVTLAVNRGTTLEVLILDAESDAGAEGVQVIVSGGQFHREQTTDANGLVRLRAPADTCRIQGVKPMYGVVYPERQVELEKGQTDREEMRLNGMLAVNVSGIVVDPQGHPVAGASITHWPFWLVPPTDADGRFQYAYYTTGSGNKHPLMARDEASGLARIGEVNDPSGGRRPTGRIVLQPAYSLVGRVTDPNGEGIPAAYVRLVLGSPQRSPSRISAQAEVITDSNGVYRIGAVPVPAPNDDSYYYGVVAHGPGYNEASVEPVPLSGPVDEPIHLNTIVLLPADEAVSGLVVDVNDKPVPGILVETADFGDSSWRQDAVQPHRQVLSDAQGRFRIERVCRGPVEITAQTPPPASQEGTTQTSASQKNVKIILGQTLTFARSQVGTRPAAWDNLRLGDLASQLEGKAVLLCFVDIEQRPCRHVLTQINRQNELLAKGNVVVVGVQVGSALTTQLQEWADAQIKGIHLLTPTGSEDEVQQAWGIQSLPWLVLLDSSRIVQGEGFAPAEIPAKLSTMPQIR